MGAALTSGDVMVLYGSTRQVTLTPEIHPTMNVNQLPPFNNNTA